MLSPWVAHEPNCADDWAGTDDDCVDTIGGAPKEGIPSESPHPRVRNWEDMHGCLVQG